ncbi:MAG: hypothetical protein QUS07_07175 [Methanothrix sp.]|nr:hypothetical protein [Methanothrix sp.]
MAQSMHPILVDPAPAPIPTGYVTIDLNVRVHPDKSRWYDPDGAGSASHLLTLPAAAASSIDVTLIYKALLQEAEIMRQTVLAEEASKKSDSSKS